MTALQDRFEPWVLTISEKIFEAQIETQEIRPDGWKLWLGPDAWHRLLAMSAFHEDWIKVGIQMGPHRVTETGTLSINRILGIPVVEDVNGPRRQWRLSDHEGRTLRWGEMPK